MNRSWRLRTRVIYGAPWAAALVLQLAYWNNPPWDVLRICWLIAGIVTIFGVVMDWRASRAPKVSKQDSY